MVRRRATLVSPPAKIISPGSEADTSITRRSRNGLRNSTPARRPSRSRCSHRRCWRWLPVSRTARRRPVSRPYCSPSRRRSSSRPLLRDVLALQQVELGRVAAQGEHAGGVAKHAMRAACPSTGSSGGSEAVAAAEGERVGHQLAAGKELEPLGGGGDQDVVGAVAGHHAGGAGPRRPRRGGRTSPPRRRWGAARRGPRRCPASRRAGTPGLRRARRAGRESP